MADVAGVFFLAGTFFLTLTSESELSELLRLSLDDSDELESELDEAALAAAAAAALAAAALVCFFGGVFPAFLAAAAANSLEALGRSVAADPDPVLAFLLPPEVRTGLGLFLRRLPRSESLALLSLKMALKRDTADAAVAFDVAEVAVEGVAVWAGVVGAGVVGADCAGVAGFGVCPPAEDADGVMLPLACEGQVGIGQVNQYTG